MQQDNSEEVLQIINKRHQKKSTVFSDKVQTVVDEIFW